MIAQVIPEETIPGASSTPQCPQQSVIAQISDSSPPRTNTISPNFSEIVEEDDDDDSILDVTPRFLAKSPSIL